MMATKFAVRMTDEIADPPVITLNVAFAQSRWFWHCLAPCEHVDSAEDMSRKVREQPTLIGYSCCTLCSRSGN